MDLCSLRSLRLCVPLFESVLQLNRGTIDEINAAKMTKVNQRQPRLFDFHSILGASLLLTLWNSSWFTETIISNRVTIHLKQNHWTTDVQLYVGTYLRVCSIALKM